MENKSVINTVRDNIEIEENVEDKDESSESTESTNRSMNQHQQNMDSVLNTQLKDLRRLIHSKEDETSTILHNLLTTFRRREDKSQVSWIPILIKLLGFILHKRSQNTEDENALLASRLFLTISSEIFTIQLFESCMKMFLDLNTKSLVIFDTKFEVSQVELLKLIIIHGYLDLSKHNLYTQEICTGIFEVLEAHCMKYTQHTCFAFKLFVKYLKYTKHMNYWGDPPACALEKLSLVMVSNWDNIISEVVELNSTEVFPTFLSIMSIKNPVYIQTQFDAVLKKLTWRNPKKYTFLKEMCKALQWAPIFDASDVQEMAKCLAISDLKDVVTDLYFTLSEKKNPCDWYDEFYCALHPLLNSWEKEGNLNALQIIWELWMKPTLLKLSDVWIYNLWCEYFSDEMIVCQSYLAKVSGERGITLTSLLKYGKSADINNDRTRKIINIWVKTEDTRIPLVLQDARESVRLNGFAVYVRELDFPDESDYKALTKDSSHLAISENKKDVDYEICKWFLYYNTKILTPSFKVSIYQSFHVFLEKLCGRDISKATDFLQWLYEFVLNCFEIDSCYERKLFGHLELYTTILEFVDTIEDGKNMKMKMEKAYEWTFQNKYTFYYVARLCLDAADEIRKKACDILCKYFDLSILTQQEKDVLFNEAVENCKSLKAHEISGGVKLLKLITSISSENVYVHFFNEVKGQLSIMKTNADKIVDEISYFYHLLVEVLEICHDFADINCKIPDKHNFAWNLMNFLEETTLFLLSLIISESQDERCPSLYEKADQVFEKMMKDAKHCCLSPNCQKILQWINKSFVAVHNAANELMNIESETEDFYERTRDIILSTILIVKFSSGKTSYSSKIPILHMSQPESVCKIYIVDPVKKLFNLYLRKLQEVSSQPSAVHNQDENDPLVIFRVLKCIYSKAFLSEFTLHLEETAIACLKLLRSNEETIRSESFLLLDVIAPYLVGQRSAEATWTAGYSSIDHFMTHFSNLAEYVTTEIADFDRHGSCLIGGLTLLSKLASNGCELMESPLEKFIFPMITLVECSLSHSDDKVRNLAAKTLAAWCAPCRLLTFLLDVMGNFVHEEDCGKGSYSLQNYIQIRRQHESNFETIEDSEIIQMETECQVQYLADMFHDWIADNREIDYSVAGVFIKYLLASPELEYIPGVDIVLDDAELLRKMNSEKDEPEFWEFIDLLAEFYGFFATSISPEENMTQFLSNVNHSTAVIMRHLVNLEDLTNVTSEEIKRFFDGNCNSDKVDQLKIRQDLVSKLSYKVTQLLKERDENTAEYLPDILGFITRVIEKSISLAPTYIKDPDCGIEKLIIELVSSNDYDQQKLGYVMMATLGDNFPYRKSISKAISFIADIIRDDNEQETLWALKCLEKLLNKKCFVGLEDSVQRKVVESFVRLLNDESTEIRDSVSKKFLLFQLVPERSPSGLIELPISSEIYLHKVLHTAVTAHPTSNDEHYREWLRNFVNDIIDDNKDEGIVDLQNLFVDSKNYLEHGKIVNTLIHLTRHVQSLSYHFPNIMYEELDITEVIEVGNRCQKEFMSLLKMSNSNKLSLFFNIRVEDYLKYKKRILHESIGK